LRLLPAIDIFQGSAVRLVRGDFEQRRIYDADPVRAAAEWVEQGALALHVVDLDGARDGAPVNVNLLRRITSEVDVPVQYGGGLRTPAAVDQAIEAGADRVVLGTAALDDSALVAEVLELHGPARTVVSLDVRGGRPAIAGWTESSETDAPAELARLSAAGVEHFVYTDVERDGLLVGPDLDGVRALLGAGGAGVTYSGGVATLEDLEQLAGMPLEGVIVGKALYERRFTVAEARAVLAD